jgi:16S rRNA (cytosine1402-N4)-methyltransferase
MSEQPPFHKRRIRYKGKNPRRFEDRYKELNPTKYAAQVEHVIAKGNTPAGTHRPICVQEILEVLDPKPGQTFLDATLGYGGHSLELLARLLPGGRLFALDVDPLELPKTEARLRAMGYSDDVLVTRQLNFSGVRSLLHEAGGGFNGVLADLGVSSMQIDNPARGFTFKADGPLDLRLNPKRGRSASDLLASTSVEKLEEILFEYADEPHADIIARAVKASRRPIISTVELAGVVRDALANLRPKLLESAIKKSLQRTFMAIRIAVNEELSVLDRFLQVLPCCLHSGGRVAILSFHSGEDRRVKKAFQLGLQSGIYSKIAPSPVVPSSDECRANPRASCAKLRWAIRSDNS